MQPSDFPLWAQVKVIHWWGYYVWWNCSGCSCGFCNWGGIMSWYLYLQLMSIFLYGDLYFVTFLFVSLLLSQMPARVLSWFHLAGTFWVFYLIYLHPHFHKSISSASCSIIYWLKLCFTFRLKCYPIVFWKFLSVLPISTSNPILTRVFWVLHVVLYIDLSLFYIYIKVLPCCSLMNLL